MVAKKKKAMRKLSEEEKKERARERIRKRSYVDRRGRRRFKEGDGLVSRKVAYNEIYLENKEKYPLEFREYVVYHKDKKRENFDSDNLELVSAKEHRKRNRRLRSLDRQKRLEPSIKSLVILLFISVIVFPAWLITAAIYHFSEFIQMAGFLIIILVSLLAVVSSSES